MNRSIASLALLPLLLFSLAVHGQSTGNRYGKMAESMLDMMDAFASAYQKRHGSNPMNQAQNWTGGSWSPAMTPWSGLYGNPLSHGFSPWSMASPMSPATGMTPFGMTTPGAMPWQQTPANPFWGAPFQGGGMSGAAPGPRSPLDGRWQGRTGEILEIHDGRFRITRGAQESREGIIDRIDDGRLSMRDPGSGVSRSYEYAVDEGRLVLRDAAGNLLLYRQISP